MFVLICIVYAHKQPQFVAVIMVSNKNPCHIPSREISRFKEKEEIRYRLAQRNSISFFSFLACRIIDTKDIKRFPKQVIINIPTEINKETRLYTIIASLVFKLLQFRCFYIKPQIFNSTLKTAYENKTLKRRMRRKEQQFE